MTKIRITMEIAEEFSDPEDLTGVTNEAFEGLMDALISYGDDIDIARDDD